MQPIYNRDQYRIERSNKRDEAFVNYAHGTWGKLSNMPPDFCEIGLDKKILLAGDLKFCPPEGKEFSILTWQADVYRANYPASCYLFYWFFDPIGRLMRAEDVPNLKVISHSCQFMPVALDHNCRDLLKGWDRQPMTEFQWVQFLYHLRDQRMPKQLARTLTTQWQQVTLPTIQGKLK